MQFKNRDNDTAEGYTMPDIDPGNFKKLFTPSVYRIVNDYIRNNQDIFMSIESLDKGGNDVIPLVGQNEAVLFIAAKSHNSLYINDSYYIDGTKYNGSMKALIDYMREVIQGNGSGFRNLLGDVAHGGSMQQTTFVHRYNQKSGRFGLLSYSRGADHGFEAADTIARILQTYDGGVVYEDGRADGGESPTEGLTSGDSQQKRRSHDEVEGQINMWDYMAEMDAQEAENGAQAEALRQFQNAWNELREAERAWQAQVQKAGEAVGTADAVAERNKAETLKGRRPMDRRPALA